ncbi:hypothetical protein L6R50_13150 [Myxococcota bacterium]|nr:hypothetical protein [Myxococcota bacterium]
MSGEKKVLRIGPTKLTSTTANTKFDLLQTMDLLGYREFSALLTVLGSSGTSQTLDLALIHGAVNNEDLMVAFPTGGSFTQVTAAASLPTVRQLYIVQFSRYLNFQYTLGGTNPTFTIQFDVVPKV